MTLENQNLVDLCVTENGVHEFQITSALRDANIKFVVQSFYDHYYNGLFQRQMGHSKILVFENDLPDAREIVKQIPYPGEENPEGNV